MTKTRQQIQQEIVNLKSQIDSLVTQLDNTPIDWSKLNTDKEILDIVNSDIDWNEWDKCPVGSIIPINETWGKSGHDTPPGDNVLFFLGLLSGYAFDSNWTMFIRNLQLATKHRIEELEQ